MDSTIDVLGPCCISLSLLFHTFRRTKFFHVSFPLTFGTFFYIEVKRLTRVSLLSRFTKFLPIHFKIFFLYSTMFLFTETVFSISKQIFSWCHSPFYCLELNYSMITFSIWKETDFKIQWHPVLWLAVNLVLLSYPPESLLHYSTFCYFHICKYICLFFTILAAGYIYYKRILFIMYILVFFFIWMSCSTWPCSMYEVK